MAKPELLSVGTAEIIGNTIEITISAPHETKIYQYCLDDIVSLVYFPRIKGLCIQFEDNSDIDFDNVISVENTQELNQ